jgi:hypothetical protein
MSIDEAETPQGEVARTGIGAATSGTLRLRHRLTGFRAGRSCRRENAAGAVAANNVRRATSSMASVLERIGTWQISPNLNRHGTLIVINFAY